MDLLKDDIGKLFRKYFIAAFGSSLISSIYGVVDTAMVGQYHGPDGSAAMAVVAPVWNIIYSLALLSGIGGSVLYSVFKGREKDSKEADRFFSAAVILNAVIAALLLAAFIFFEEPLLRLFGADDDLLPLAMQYLKYIRFFIPVFMFSSTLSAFLRNDSHPQLATKAVIAGGIFNIAGDYVFIFVFDMGAEGASLATALGALLSLCVIMTHFISKKNTLRFARPERLGYLEKKIIAAGASAFFIDLAMGILTTLFNRQIMRYLGTDALAVYGIIANLSTFVQCCAYGVGQAAQPIISRNFGAGRAGRIRSLLKYCFVTIAVIACVWLAAMMLFPNTFIRLFMTPTESVLNIAPFILRCYATSFPFLLLNVFSTYYFQSVLRSGTAFIVSVSRGLIVSGILIMVLPLVFGASVLWIAMTIAEIIVSAYVVFQIIRTIGKPAGA